MKIRIEHVIDEFGAALGRVAAVYERDAGLREDLLQEIVLAIFRALPQLQDRARLKAFVFRIAHNRGVSHVVKQTRVRSKCVAVDPEESNESGPEQSVLASERSRRLVAAVRALPLPYRQVMTLLLEDLSYVEIAEALGLSPSNVGVRINRAKARLKELLNHD